MCPVLGRVCILILEAYRAKRGMPKIIYWAKYILDVCTVCCGDTEENLFQKFIFAEELIHYLGIGI